MRFYYSSKLDLYYEKAMTLYFEEGMCGTHICKVKQRKIKNNEVVWGGVKCQKLCDLQIIKKS